MDPFSALGLASNVVNFIDFTSRIINGSLELYHSTDGATVTHRVLEDVTKDLGNLCDGLTRTQSSILASGPSDSESALLPLLEPCEKLGHELLYVLEGLKVQGRGKAWKSVRQALKSVWKANKIKNYQEQLDLYKSQFATRLLSLLWIQQKSMLENQQRLGINVRENMSKLRGDIQTSLARSIKGDDLLERGNAGLDFSRELPGWLSKLHEESCSSQKQIDIISSLYYPRSEERERNVKDPHPKTYDWLFEGPRNACESHKASNVLDWLQAGKDVFWVSGKAGSGKSVLMKHLYNHQKTHAALKKWALKKDLVVAGFFFWSAGSTMQKGQQGLLQSLLMCILKQRPDLVPHLCPGRWNAKLKVEAEKPWSKSELLKALTGLTSKKLNSTRFCFFIDGMDEYEGSLLELLRLVKNLTKSGYMKVFASSRSCNVSEKFFGHNGGKRIYLQHLNRPDIWQFAYDQLAGGVDRRSNLINKTEYLALVHEIVEQSSGVFLWVFLVVRSLLLGMTNLDTAEELGKRLRELPPELDEFFRRILDRGDKVYSKQAARLYILQLEAGDAGLFSRDLAHFAEEEQSYALRGDVPSRHATMVEQLDSITRTRILARCQDLLEFDGTGRLQFLHRTVRDFLETRDVLDDLTRRAGEEFNSHTFVCNSMLVQMKAILHHGIRGLGTEQLALTMYPLAHFMRQFWYHTRKLAATGRLSLDLIAELDETLCLLHAHSRNCYCCLRLWITLGTINYHKGWIADLAIREGVPEILSLQIGKTEQLVVRNQIWRKPPLEKALVYMHSDDRLNVILDLLRCGGNPNEVNQDNNSVWEAYLIQLDWPSNFPPRLSEIKILENLLTYGADPSSLFNKAPKCYEILSAIAKGPHFNLPMLSQDFRRCVSDFLSAERPKLPTRSKKRVLDVEKKEPCKRQKESSSEPSTEKENPDSVMSN